MRPVGIIKIRNHVHQVLIACYYKIRENHDNPYNPHKHDKPYAYPYFGVAPPIIYVSYRRDDETYNPYRHGYKGNNRIKRFH